MLKGAFTVGLLGLTIGLISFGISYTRSPREPTVDVPAVIDLGVQAKGRHVETGFLIRNRGMEALVLRNFGTTCGCVRPFRRRATGQTEVVEEVVPPLSEIEIHVGAAIRGDKGDFEHWVRFDTNDPGRPHVEIALIGKVDIGVYTTPSQLHLGRLHPGQEVQQTVRSRRLQNARTSNSAANQVQLTRRSHRRTNVFQSRGRPKWCRRGRRRVPRAAIHHRPQC